MRVVHYRLRTTVVLVGVAVLALAVRGSLERGEEELHAVNIEDAKSRTYYRIDAQQTFTAELQGDSLVRVVSILAEERRSGSFDREVHRPYRLQFELLDAGFRELWRGTTDLDTRKTLVQRVNEQTGIVETLQPAFMDDPALMLLDPRWSSLPVGRLAPQARFLRVSVDEPVESTVFLRCFSREPPLPEELLAAWDERDFDDQQALARYNLFPASVIDDSEKERLMANRWSHLPGWGTPGRDHMAKTIFRHDQTLIEEAREAEAEPTPTWIDAERSVALAVMGGRPVRVRAWNRAEAVGHGPLRARWTLGRVAEDGRFRHLAGGLAQIQLVPGGVEDLLLVPVPEGEGHWLILAAEQGAAELGASQLTPDAEAAVADDAPGGAWYAVGPRTDGSAPVSFELPLSVGSSSAWYRLEARWAVTGEAVLAGLDLPQVALPFACQWLNEAGGELGSSALVADIDQDRLAWTPNRELRRIGRGTAWYLRPPAAARLLRVTAPVSGMVRIFARPPSVPLTVLAHSVVEAEEEIVAEAASAWHQVRPRAYTGRRYFVRRPALDPDAAAPPLPAAIPAWSSVQPVGTAADWQLLWPVEGLERPDRELHWTPSLFARHAPDLRWRGAGLGLPVPGLPDHLQLLAGGSPPRTVLLEGAWNGTAGDGPLVCGIPEGPEPPRAWWRLLSAWRCTAEQSLTWPIDKLPGSAALLHLSCVHCPDPPEQGRRGAVDLEVLILGPEDVPGAAAAVSTAFTYRRRVVRVPIVHEVQPAALREDGTLASAVAGFGVALQDDLPPGRHRVQVRVLGEGELYLRAVQRIAVAEGTLLPAGAELDWDLVGPATVTACFAAGNDPGSWRWQLIGAGGMRSLPLRDEARRRIAIPPGPHGLVAINGSVAAGRVGLVGPAAADQRQLLLRSERPQAERVLLPRQNDLARQRLDPGAVLRVPAPDPQRRELLVHLCLIGDPFALAPPHRFLLAERDGAGRVGRVHTLTPGSGIDSRSWLPTGLVPTELEQEVTVTLRLAARCEDLLIWPVDTDGRPAGRSWLAAARWRLDHGRHWQLARNSVWRRHGVAAALPYPGDAHSEVAETLPVVAADPPAWLAFGARLASDVADGYAVREPLRSTGDPAMPARPWQLECVSAGGAAAVRVLRGDPTWLALDLPAVEEDPEEDPEEVDAWAARDPVARTGSVLFFLPAADVAAAWAPNRFLPLQAGSVQELRAPDDQALLETPDWRPRLAWHQTGDLQAVRLRLLLDDRLWWEEELRSRSGLLELPRPLAGSHRLAVAVSGGTLELAIDADLPGVDGALRLRQAWRADRDGALDVALELPGDRERSLVLPCWVRVDAARPGAVHRVVVDLVAADAAVPPWRLDGFLVVPDHPDEEGVASLDGEDWVPLGSLGLRLPPSLPGGAWRLRLRGPVELPLLWRCLEARGAQAGGETGLLRRWDGLGE